MSVYNEKDYRETNEELLDFINRSPSPFHAVDNIKKYLLENGYEELSEKERWDRRIEEGGKYFTTRNYSSVIAFEIPEKECFPDLILLRLIPIRRPLRLRKSAR